MKTVRIVRGIIITLLIVAALGGCPVGEPGPSPEVSLLGRWVLNSGTIVATYWFYDDLTMHRESTVLGFTTYGAGFYSTTGTTLDLQVIGSPPESYSFEIEGTILTLIDPGVGSLPFVKQATLGKPANGVPSVAIDGGDAMAIPGSQVGFAITVSHADTEQDLACQWYVDGALQDGETADTFMYDVPFSGTTHAIVVAVSDGFDLASDTIALTSLSSSSEFFEQWDGDSFESTGIFVPEGTLDAFTYWGNLTVRFANNDLWTYSGGAWSELDFSAPTGTIQATSLDLSSSFHYVLARDADGILSVYEGGAWADYSPYFPAMPSATVDFTCGGSSVMVVLSSGAIQHSETTAAPYADCGNQPGGVVRHIGLGDYSASPIVLAVNDSGLCSAGDDLADPAWTTISGVTIPSDAVDVFLYGDLITIRR
jgi:hypothetical protein